MITPEIIASLQTQVRNFLLGLIDLRPGSGVRACAMNVGGSPGGVSTVRNGGCHAMLGSVKNPVCIGGGFMPKAEQMEQAQKFWAWITDKDKSPWKMLMQNGIELVIHPDDNLPIGWILPYETVKSTPFLLQKNFCILTRVFTEKPDNFVIWEKLLNKGLTPDDALYLASFLTKTKVENGYTYNGSNMTGAHWPLTDYQYIRSPNQRGSIYGHDTFKKMDFHAYRTGKLIDNDAQPGPKGFGDKARDAINGYFQEITPSDREIFDLTKYCQEKTSGGSFSALKFYDLDEIIDGFYRWQDQEGILDVGKN